VNGFIISGSILDTKLLVILKSLLSHDATTVPAVDIRAEGKSPLTGEADECSLAQDATRGVVSSSCVGVVLVPDRAPASAQDP
jgi:hypothetical protein